MVHINLFLDWDGTLTKHDTILPLTRIGYKANESKGITTRPWDEIVNAYLQDLEAHNSSYEPAKAARTTIEQESAYLASLKAVEVASVRRVDEAGIFANVTTELLMGTAEALRSGEVEMREGWEHFFEILPKEPNHLLTAIVTVNWSASFIRDCMWNASDTMLSAEIKLISVLGNEINDYIGLQDKKYHNPDVELYFDEKAIHTSADKLHALQSAMATGRAKAEAANQSYLSVYVGDTITDFDCILAADIGVSINDVPLRGGQLELSRTLGRVNVDVLPLREARKDGPWHRRERKVVYWVNGLDEIAAFVEAELHGT